MKEYDHKMVHSDHGLNVERQSLEYLIKKMQGAKTQIRRET